MRSFCFFLTMVVLLGTQPAFAEGPPTRLGFTTLNCYWFFQEPGPKSPPPLKPQDLSKKAGHLVGLLSEEAPLFVGLQEIGKREDVELLAHAANQRYGRAFQPLFVQGKDTATEQDVGALLDTTRGWGVHGQPARVSELEKHLSKHLVIRLTNEVVALDVCVVHLRVPSRVQAVQKQKEQNRALLRWAMRHLSKNPKANLLILGDFNEHQPVGSGEQNLAVLFAARPPLVDVFEHFKGEPVTHAGGKALDRILVSDAIFRGKNGLRFAEVQIRKHSQTKPPNLFLYTDHYPVTAWLDLAPGKQ